MKVPLKIPLKVSVKITADLEQQFFEILSKTGNVTAGASAIGLKRSQLYHKRKTNEKFRQQWEDAMNEALDHLESQLWKRALGQTDMQKNTKGQSDVKKSSTDEKAEERLAMFLLKAHRPEIFGDAKARQKTEDHEKTGSPRQRLLKKLKIMKK